MLKVSGCTHQALQDGQERIEHCLANAVARGFTAQRRQLTKWMKQMWVCEPGLLHKRVKDGVDPAFEQFENVASPAGPE
eukprot:7743889-Pyramimonas_sp.AAC.1